MRLSAAITLALTALLLTSTLGVVSVSSAAPAGPGGAQSPLTAAVTDAATPDPADPRQVIHVAVTDDGDAVWTIESRFRLENETDRDAFEAHAEAIAAGERDVGYGDTFERFLQAADASTDREMTLEDDGWDDPQVEPVDDEDYELGIVSYSVTWTNFAVVDGDRVYLDDAFRTDDGTWFPTLTDSQRLIIERPQNSTGVELKNAPPEIQNRMFIWDGPYEFDDDEFQITFRVDGGNGGGGGGLDPRDPPSTGFVDVLLSPVGLTTAFGLLALLAVVGIGGYRLASRETPSVLTRGRDDDRPDAGAMADPPTDGPATAVEFDDASVDDGLDAIDVELLSDEERVLRLLRGNGGRMKQARIVEETGWSNAKVSQLLSKMDEDGEIEKLRIGRENLITLPEVDPTEID